MTPEQLQEMYDFYQTLKSGDLPYPMSDQAKNALGAATYVGTSNIATTQPLVVGVGGGTFNVAKQPTGFLVLNIEGGQYIVATYNT